MSAADALLAWRLLSNAMLKTAPLCIADPRYTSDELTQGDLSEMREKCAICPLLGECAGYSRAASPAAGFFAGQKFPRPTGRPKAQRDTDVEEYGA